MSNSSYEPVEYPKMIYDDKGGHVIVKDREEQLEKQREGYHEHDGTFIEDPDEKKDTKDKDLKDNKGAPPIDRNPLAAGPDSKDKKDTKDKKGK